MSLPQARIAHYTDWLVRERAALRCHDAAHAAGHPAIVFHLEYPGRESYMPPFVVLRDGVLQGGRFVSVAPAYGSLVP